VERVITAVRSGLLLALTSERRVSFLPVAGGGGHLFLRQVLECVQKVFGDWLRNLCVGKDFSF
jgi:hypothetical protein